MIDWLIDWSINWFSSFLFADFRVAVEVSRGGTRARRKALSDRSQQDDYSDYYYYHYREHRPSIRTARPPPPHYRATPPTPPFLIKCYSCYYRWKQNEWAGMKRCAEPFSPFNIPTVNCSGPCGVTRPLFWQSLFTISDHREYLYYIENVCIKLVTEI